MLQIVLTPAAGKRLIAKAIAGHPAIQAALQTGTIVIVASGGVCGAEGSAGDDVTAICYLN